MSLEMFKSFAKGYDKKVDINNNVILYTRVSSKNQHDNNHSLETQISNAEAFMMRKGFNRQQTFGGTYESAKGDFTRKEFSKLINMVRESKIKPYAILINTLSRFSRSGGNAVGLASELVEGLGVHIIEVTTGRSTETIDGRAEIYKGLIDAKKENDERLKITLPGMKSFLEKGNWLGRVPRGYDHYGPRVKDGKYSKEQKVTLDSEGEILKQAWQWKLQGERDYIIEAKLKNMGLDKVNKQFLSKMWRNPFYCGICAHKMLDGKVTNGNWEKMISEEEFLIVQEIIKGNRQGYKQDKSNPDRPLNAFICCVGCGGKLAGYEVKKKRKHYYKCQVCKGVSINANTTINAKGKGAHDLFVELLNTYSLNDSLTSLYKTQLKLTYETLNKESSDESISIKKELERHQDSLRSLNKRYATDLDFDKEVYKEMKDEFGAKINELSVELGKCESKISNLDKYIDVSELIAKNISKYWCSESLETKRRVQELVFKGGLSLDVKNRSYLTKEINYIFELNNELTRATDGVNEKRQPISRLPSSMVAGE